MGVPGAPQPAAGARAEGAAHVVPVAVRAVRAAAGRAPGHRRGGPSQPEAGDDAEA